MKREASVFVQLSCVVSRAVSHSCIIRISFRGITDCLVSVDWKYVVDGLFRYFPKRKGKYKQREEGKGIESGLNQREILHLLYIVLGLQGKKLQEKLIRIVFYTSLPIAAAAEVLFRIVYSYWRVCRCERVNAIMV